MTSVTTTWRAPTKRAIAVAMMPIGPAPVISTSSPTMLNASAVWVALPNGSRMEAMSSGIESGSLKVLSAGMRQVLGEGARTVHADADGVAAQVTAPGAAVAAMAAGDVAFARDAVADLQPARPPSQSRRCARSTRARPPSAPGWSSAPTRPSCRCACRCRRSRSWRSRSARRCARPWAPACPAARSRGCLLFDQCLHGVSLTALRGSPERLVCLTGSRRARVPPR